MVTQKTTVAPEGLYIPLDKIRDGLEQVRRDWAYDGGREKLEELTESIRLHGVLQPIEVSPRSDGFYDVLVGHRRFEAARRLKSPFIPCVVRHATEQERQIVQLVENLVRQDLSPVDQGLAYARMIQEQGYTMRSLAHELGVHVRVIKSHLRLSTNPILREAACKGLIYPHVALKLTEMHPDYAAPLYERLQRGYGVVLRDVDKARHRQHKSGVFTSNRYGAQKGMYKPEIESLANKIASMHARGMGHHAIAAELGIAQWTERHLFDLATQSENNFDEHDEGVPTENSGLTISIDDPTRLVVRVEPTTASTPASATPNAVRSPLPYRASDAPQEPQERSAPMEITAYQQPSRPAEVTWCDVCAPFAGAAFERALSWAASRGMTAVDMLEQYRAQRR